MGAFGDQPERQAELRRGPKGQPGSPAYGWRFGPGAPQVDVGLIGDYYMDTVRYRIYGPKLEGGWEPRFAQLITDAPLNELIADLIQINTDSQQALADFLAQKGAPEGIATLDADGNIPFEQLPVGTTAGTVAAGDDARFEEALTKSGNLAGMSDPLAATGELLFKFLSSESVSRYLIDKLREEGAISVLDFAAEGDGVTDDGPAFQKAFDFANGRKVYAPPFDAEGNPKFYYIGSKVLYKPLPDVDADPRPPRYAGSFAAGLNLHGAGMTRSIIICGVANDFAFDLDVTMPPPPAYRAAQGMNISGICFVGDVAKTNAGAIRLFNIYQSKIEQCHFRLLTGAGIDAINGLAGYVNDSGWNMLRLRSLWFEACGIGGDAFAFDATGEDGRNEGSFTDVTNVFFQSCGKNQYFSITGVSQTNPVVLTLNLNQMPANSPAYAAHPFVQGDEIRVFGVRKDVALTADPFSVVDRERLVTITWAAHGLLPGQRVTISGAAAVGGITLAGDYAVRGVVGVNQFTVEHSAAANATAVGGGAAVAMNMPMTELNDKPFTVGPGPTATTLTLYTNDAVPVAVSGLTWGAFASNLPGAVALANNPFQSTFTADDKRTVVVTHAAHGAVAGDLVRFAGAVAVGGVVLNGEYRITATGDAAGADTANKYRISAQADFTAAEAGGGAAVTAQYTYRHTIPGEVGWHEARSGAMRSKNQLTALNSCGFTVNHNAAQLIRGGAGGNIGLYCRQVTWENSYRRHFQALGGINYIFDGCQVHGNNQAGLRQWRLFDFDASKNVVTGILFRGTKIRAKECPSIAFKYSGANADPNTVRLEGTIYADYDYMGQIRHQGIQFDGIPQDLRLYYSAPTVLQLRPDQSRPTGNKWPVRARGPNNDSGTGVPSATGEWTARQMTSNNGLTITNAGLPAVATLYNLYTFDNDGVVAWELSTIAPTIDLEYGVMVKTGDPTKLWAWQQVQTAADGTFTTTAHEHLDPLRLGGAQLGQPAYLWPDNVARRLHVRYNTRPTTAVGETWGCSADFTGSVTIDSASIPSLGSVQIPVTTGMTSAVGDVPIGVSANPTNSLMLNAQIGTNTGTITAFNPTGAAIDPASTLYRLKYQRL
jgi:hypothetical protein